MESRDLLKKSGLRRTPAREAVLGLLCAARRPLSHEQIASAPSMKGLDRVTLYRTLAKLQEAGLSHRVQGKDGVWHFCAHPAGADGCPGNHPHFLCLQCGSMRCLNEQTLPWVAVDAGERVIGKQLIVYGWCASCSERSGKPARPPR